MNFFLPGSGLIYLGRRRTGILLAGLFLACFAVALGWFLLGYLRYFQLLLTSDDLLKDGTLERIGTVFPKTSLLILAAIGVVLYFISMVLYRSAARELAAKGLAK